jgi:hypothetical protein
MICVPYWQLVVVDAVMLFNYWSSAVLLMMTCPERCSYSNKVFISGVTEDSQRS